MPSRLKRVLHTVAEATLRSFAEFEFRVEGSLGKTVMRRLYLRYMHVSTGTHFVWGTGSYLHQRGNLQLGERSGIGSFARIWNYQKISIGADVVCAGSLSLNTGGHDPETMQPRGGPIAIGDRVWLGMNVTVLGGVTIHNDVVVAAGSVVISDLGPNCIAAGIPAKPIRALSRGPGTRFWDWTQQDFRELC